jgi:hypothetical protein
VRNVTRPLVLGRVSWKISASSFYPFSKCTDPATSRSPSPCLEWSLDSSTGDGTFLSFERRIQFYAMEAFIISSSASVSRSHHILDHTYTIDMSSCWTLLTSCPVSLPLLYFLLFYCDDITALKNGQLNISCGCKSQQNLRSPCSSASSLLFMSIANVYSAGYNNSLFGLEIRTAYEKSVSRYTVLSSLLPRRILHPHWRRQAHIKIIPSRLNNNVDFKACQAQQYEYLDQCSSMNIVIFTGHS